MRSNVRPCRDAVDDLAYPHGAEGRAEARDEQEALVSPREQRASRKVALEVLKARHRERQGARLATLLRANDERSLRQAEVEDAPRPARRGGGPRRTEAR